MGPNGGNGYVTKKDFEEFKAEMRELFGVVARRFDQLEGRINDVELHLSQRLERAETTLLTGFHSQMRSIETRMARMRADVTNVDQEMQGRLEAIESRITEIEKRLPLP